MEDFRLLKPKVSPSAMAYMLSGDEILKLAPRGSSLWKQSDLDLISDIDQLFTRGPNAFIFMEAGETRGNLFGHWTLLIDRGGDSGYIFFDPYGRSPAKAYEKYVKGKFREGNHLLDLLDAKYEEIYVNRTPFQATNEAIQTCGRHVVMRSWFDELTNEQYKEMIKRACEELEVTPDALSVMFTT
jgi:hypothetical protein